MPAPRASMRLIKEALRLKYDANLMVLLGLLALVFLFEDHKIAWTSFVLPEGCRKVSTRAFLMFLEEHSWIDSAHRISASLHKG